LRLKDRGKEHAMHVEDIHRLVTEIEILKAVEGLQKVYTHNN
jgi:hypothetical protein